MAYEETFEINGEKIKTTVTSDVKVIENHLSSFLPPSTNHQTKVFGFDVEWFLIPKMESRIIVDSKCATLQVCDGHTCLIIQLYYLCMQINPGYKSLLNFLWNPNVTFVGVGIKENLVKLEKDYGFVIRNVVELGPLAANALAKPRLRYCGDDELCYLVNGFHLGEQRFIPKAFDWGYSTLSKELVNLATINVYSYYKIGCTLFMTLEEHESEEEKKDMEVVVDISVEPVKRCKRINLRPKRFCYLALNRSKKKGSKK